MTRVSWYEPIGCGNAVNANGQVISLPRRISAPRGSRWIPARIRALFVSNSGYLQVSLKGPVGSTINKYVHRLVAEAFIPNPDGLKEVNHKDGNKLNPKAENLEWCTREANVEHSKSTLGFCNSGENNGQSKLTAFDVQHIWNLSLEGLNNKEIAKKFGISHGQIGKILRGEKWKELSQKLGYLTLKRMA